MADIYLIYGREDEEVAGDLETCLRSRWTVWWDRLVKERFVDEIHEEIGKACCALVLWSTLSREKDTVIDEIRLAQKHGLKIVCVSLDGCENGYGFGGYSSTPLQGWDGTQEHPAYQALFMRLAHCLPDPVGPTRPLVLADGRLALPTLFLSVSSFETQLFPHEAVQALDIARAPAILVSAWDLVRRRKPERLINALRDYRRNGGFLLLDSGNYEKTRLATKQWTHKDFAGVLGIVPHDWAFSFDSDRAKARAGEPADVVIERTAQLAIAAATRDQALTTAPVLPAIHAPRLDQGYNFEILPAVTHLVAERLRPPLIGIPERELGAGIFQRIRTMRAIRRALATLPFYQPVHLLGTGNPWTVMLMAAAGADTFDGLEWCRVVVDQLTDRLNHFQHFDLFTYQTAAAGLVASGALTDEHIDFAGKVAFHNIDYFLLFGEDLRAAIAEHRLEAFIDIRLGKPSADLLQKAKTGLFH